MFGAKPKKIKDLGKCKIWGVHSKTRSGLVPEFVNQCLNYFMANGGKQILVTGLFRQPGNHESIQRIKYAVEKRKRIDFAAYSPHDIASAFKQFFSDASDPLFTLELYDCAMAAAALPLEEQRLECLHKVLELLPPGNLFLLKTLLKFLSCALAHSSINKMNSSNLATCWAPCLIRSKPADPTVDTSLQISEVLLAQSLVELMIDNYSVLFPDLSSVRLSPSSSLLPTSSSSASPTTAAGSQKPAQLSEKKSTLTPKQAEYFTQHLTAAQLRLSVAVLQDELDPDDQVEPGFFAPEDVLTGDADVDKAISQLQTTDLINQKLLAQCVGFLLCTSSGAMSSNKLFIKHTDNADEQRRFEAWFAKQSLEKLTSASASGSRRSSKLFSSGSGLSVAELTSSLLLSLLERMPEPLMVAPLHECWLLAMRQPMSEQRLHFRTVFTYLLPPMHRQFLASLFTFLSLVVDQYHATNLSAFHLTTTFAPLLLRRPGVPLSSPTAYSDDSHQVVQFFIEQSSRVCRPPNRKPPLPMYTQLLRDSLTLEALASLSSSAAPSSPMSSVTSSFSPSHSPGSSSSSSDLPSVIYSSSGKKFDAAKAKQKAIQKSLPAMLKKRAQLAERGILVPVTEDGARLSPIICPPLSDVTLSHIIQFLPDSALYTAGLFEQPAERELVRGLVLSLPELPDLGQFSPITISQVLLSYLRDQLEPVIPFRHYDTFISGLIADSRRDSPDHLRAAVASLPAGRSTALYAILDLCYKYCSCQKNNADVIINVSRAIAQAIFRCPQLISGPEAEKAAMNEVAVVKTLLLNHSSFSPPPAPPPRRRTLTTSDPSTVATGMTTTRVQPTATRSESVSLPNLPSAAPVAASLAAQSEKLPIGLPPRSPTLSPRSPRRELDRCISTYTHSPKNPSSPAGERPTSPFTRNSPVLTSPRSERFERSFSQAIPRLSTAPSTDLLQDRGPSSPASPGRVSAKSVGRTLLQQRAETRIPKE